MKYQPRIQLLVKRSNLNIFPWVMVIIFFSSPSLQNPFCILAKDIKLDIWIVQSRLISNFVRTLYEIRDHSPKAWTSRSSSPQGKSCILSFIILPAPLSSHLHSTTWPFTNHYSHIIPWYPTPAVASPSLMMLNPSLNENLCCHPESLASFLPPQLAFS